MKRLGESAADELAEAGFRAVAVDMLGYGGIAVLMLPNGATYYYFGDNNQHSWFAAAREAYKLELPQSTAN